MGIRKNCEILLKIFINERFWKSLPEFRSIIYKILLILPILNNYEGKIYLKINMVIKVAKLRKILRNKFLAKKK